MPYYTISPTYSVCRKHGYIPGEVYTCPECGDATEVYSRITGYYRPVQNWNDGKAEEFKHRKVYDISTSKLTHERPSDEVCTCTESAPTAEHIGEHTTRTVLFTTPTCPNCKVAIPMLEKAGVVFEKLHATENAELALRLGVKQAPTLVITDGETVTRYAGVAEISAYIKSLKG